MWWWLYVTGKMGFVGHVNFERHLFFFGKISWRLPSSHSLHFFHFRSPWIEITNEVRSGILIGIMDCHLYISKGVEVFSFVTGWHLNCWMYIDKWYLIRTGLTCRWFVAIEIFHTYRNGVARDWKVSQIVKKCNYLGNYASNRNSESTLCYPTFNFGIRGVEPPWR